MKNKSILLLFGVILLAGCHSQKKSVQEQRKILKTEEYSYDGNKVSIKSTSGLDGEVVTTTKIYDERNNLLESFADDDDYRVEYKYDENNHLIYSKDNGGSGHEYFYDYDENGDMIYYHGESNGQPYGNYHAEYKNHKMIHRYTISDLAEFHEWWNFSEDFTKCDYETSSGDKKYYEFDSKGNKIYEKSDSMENFYEYDDNGKMTLHKTLFGDGSESLLVYNYDDKGNVIYDKTGSYETYYDYEFYDDGRKKSVVWYRLIN
ncbi:MAG: hypothetical protein J6N81_06515 [Treponema sp.]|nr:hypothetical protein [Treponema sp.]